MSDRRSSKRSAAARVRRNEEKRARQRQSWREAEHVRSSLTNLEDKAENWRSQWESDQAKGLTDGTAGPGFCPWSIPYGPRTQLQSLLVDALKAKIREFAATDSGRFVHRWSSLPRAEQGGFDWSSVERDLYILADQLRDEWCALLHVDGRVARSGSSLRPLLLSKLAAVFNPNFPEDWQIIEDVDRGMNIGVREPIEMAGCWPPYKAKDVPGHPITLFEKDSFRNYKSAETEEGRRIVADCLGKEIEKGYLVKETDPDHLPADAIVSKIALLEKPGRVPRAFRLISDLRRSGANDAIKKSGHLKDTASLPGLRAVALLAAHAVERFGVSARFIELDAAEAFRQLAVDSRDEKYLYGRLHLEVEIPPEKVVMICQQGDHILEQYNTKHKVAIKDVESFLALYSWCHKLKSVAGANGKPLHSAYLGRKAAEKINLLLEDILGVRLSGTQHMIVITDASLAGFAGTMLIGSQRYWFCELESGHISTLELLAAIVAVLASVRSCGIDRTEADFTVLSDNISTVEALNKGTSGSQRMADLLARLSAMGMNHRSIRAFHLPGTENVISDSLSRDGVPRPAIARVIGERVDIQPVLQEILRTDPLKAPICLMASKAGKARIVLGVNCPLL
ncbi:hypothetical protein Pmar_PMAR010447 [Perkinsus marinus ATCC 50983]|uniref:Uncharacterized protein n=1 Tax=Perkinsus marinus (strain ATCC 50983 / TXsc) TaxID=423536 RepID=C5LPZ0_PERM5|nr:hypothetical protein Pmar_PMAR010447 [Perkinsus marinus ATCC 50983]EER01204.1 hypothetical protein Pmar_PMAR010447 [Perkinsus marinus ATCC 50983]|eukprot:XP_002768486.1 hypothetical protein Pmar_PMAR010447 [Perkinsus marinus ATCC 50983]